MYNTHACRDFIQMVMVAHGNNPIEGLREANMWARGLDAEIECINGAEYTPIERLAEQNAFRHYLAKRLASGELSQIDCALAGFALGLLEVAV